MFGQNHLLFLLEIAQFQPFIQSKCNVFLFFLSLLLTVIQLQEIFCLNNQRINTSQQGPGELNSLILLNCI